MAEQKRLYIEKELIANQINSRRMKEELDEEKLRSWRRVEEYNIRISYERQLEKASQDKKVLQKQVEEVRELLRARTTGIGLMRVSFLWGLSFLVLFLISAYSKLTLVHPLLCVIGFVCSTSFFFMGFARSVKCRQV